MDEIHEFLLDIFNNEEEERVQIQNRFHELQLQRRQIRDTSDPFTLPDEYFRRYYRMTPHVVMRLIGLVETRLLRERSSAIPVHLSVLITLRFLAEGALQKGFGQDFVHPVSQTTASRCIHRVIDAINHLGNRFIRFPTTEEERQHNSNRFQMTTRIPGIIGVVDGFLVSFRRSSEHEEAFFNYRVGSSMNVQIIVDADYNILNIRVCPGCNNDRFIWQYSEAKEYMEQLRADANFPRRYYLLGDSGYTPSPVLLTPDLNAIEGFPAHAYTLEHVATRCIVERTIGILTGVWMAINRSRKLLYPPETVTKIINACAILHNFRRKHGIFDEHDHDFQPIRYNNNEAEMRVRGGYPAGIRERNQIIAQYFA